MPPTTLLLSLLLSSAIAAAAPPLLRPGFYSETCPEAESIVRDVLGGPWQEKPEALRPSCDCSSMIA
ncbi:UNVERIFIED_CONTAM: hypothetical protein Sradi_0844400 [Sesamum radiatum]|uniref:Uncharacterized protein n=1 Tax=Sesamum radiatum TaxID=300843 RepID=A0AAW2V1A1_SESRA